MAFSALLCALSDSARRALSNWVLLWLVTGASLRAK